MIELRYSDDGGHNLSNWQSRDPGQPGAFITPLVWRRLGMVREERIWEIRDASDTPADLIAASIDLA